MFSYPSTIRIGIIGAGQNTREMHLPKLLEIPGVEIREVANRSVESGKRVADEFNIPTVRETWQEVATSPDVDAVVIGTWPYLHSAATCLALESGKHVLCEARMAMNASEARTMLRAAECHTDLVAQLVPAPFTLRVDQTIRNYISNGKLGDLHYIHVDYQSASMVPSGGVLHWRRNKKYSGSNTMVLGILYESILRWLPPADWVSAMGRIFNCSAFDPETGNTIAVEIPDYLSVHMQFRNGMQGTFLISEVAQHPEIPTIRIIGSRGTLVCEVTMDGRLWYGSDKEGALEEVAIPPGNAGSWRVEEEFINTIRGQEKIQLTSFAAGVEYMKFTDAVVKSYQNSGQRVVIEE